MTAYNQKNTAGLIASLNGGEEDAFTEIYNRYWKKLFTLPANKLSNLHEAKELVQHIFLNLWKRRNAITITASLASCLCVAENFKVIKSSQAEAFSCALRVSFHGVKSLQLKQERETFRR